MLGLDKTLHQAIIKQTPVFVTSLSRPVADAGVLFRGLDMIYFITDGEYVKIGFTGADDMDQRMKALQTANARELKVIGTIEGGLEEEATLHRVFANLKVRGEWFSLGIQDTEGLTSPGISVLYKCTCGEVYEKPQSYSAHTRSCAVHKASTNGRANGAVHHDSLTEV